MTLTEFDEARFSKNDIAVYDGEQYCIGAIDFQEQLIGLLMEADEGQEQDIKWVRCENVEHITQ